MRSRRRCRVRGAQGKRSRSCASGSCGPPPRDAGRGDDAAPASPHRGPPPQQNRQVIFSERLERQPLRIRGWEFAFPTTRLSLLQMLVSATDWALAGGIFWAVLPPSAHVSYSGALTIYLLAQTAGLVTNIPGGLGVFEAVVLVLLE
ncbi:UPF0104 family protein, partial [Lacticaseibacillus rhamnosus]